MEEQTPKDTFLESLNRCSKDEGFLEVFYERFMNSSEEIRRRFVGTNMAFQKQMLLKSLTLSAGATAGDYEALQEINDRAETHSRDQLDIPPRLYDDWLAAIVSSAADFDPQWNDTVQTAWNRILGHVVQHMAKRY